jgi:glycosyltransferase involved in cell wall biosynthesis
MHVCFVGEIATPTCKTGGIGSFVANLSVELVKHGHQVSVVSFRKQQAALEYETLDGYNIYWINTNQWRKLRGIKVKLDTNRVLRQIHAHSPLHIIEAPENGLFGLHKIPGVKYVVRLQGGHVFFAKSTTDTPSSRLKAFIEKHSLKNADAVIGITNYVLTETQKYYPFIKTLPSAVIPNPVLVDRFDPSKFEGQQEDGFILFFGSLTEKKGVRQLIEAMPLVNEHVKNATLHIYGRDIPMRPSGKSYKALLNKLITDLQLKNVFIHEALPNNEMPALLAKASLIVLPSHMESLGVAWLEALVMQRPFIGSLQGPALEIITPHQNGLLCNPHQPADIAEKIIYMFSHPQEAARMAKAGRMKVLNEYNATKHVETNVRFYQSIIRS